MATEDTTAAQRLGEYVKARREHPAVDLTQKEAAAAAGIGLSTYQKVEYGYRGSLGRDTRKGIELAFGWKPGSVQRILDGGEPDLVEEEPREQEPTTNPDVGAEQIVTNPTRSASTQPSDLPPSVTVEEAGVGERTGRHLVTVRADAIGVTLTVDYDGPSDRRRALAEAMWALGIERGDNGSDGLSVPEGGDNAP